MKYELPLFRQKEMSKLMLYLGLASGHESKEDEGLSKEIFAFAQWIYENTNIIEELK